ncbi:MAG: tRNA (guanosine(46)-N7)-methyltransferase TrmB [Verrucomicrobiae bacterium]|nr:tRNA (guanosine(46)-N7)-methyltransferase TrmB [Verrucomicrobiae bacterium]
MPYRPKNEPFPLPFEVYPEEWFRRLEAGEIFPERADAVTEVDLGCGDGSFLNGMARQYPERNFLGVERLLGRVRKVCRDTRKGELANVRALRLETTYAVEWLLPRGFADRVHLLFPDPWPRKKHHKRRLMRQPKFLRSVHDLLKPGGEFWFKTDHEEYFDVAEEALQEIDFFERLPWPEDEFYPVTDFEQVWQADGRKIQGIRLRKIATA